MPLQAVEPTRLYRQIADQLRCAIRAGEFEPGSRLPAERELAQRLKVSRPSVREAMIALEVEGFVEVRPGSGVHVLDGRAEAPAQPGLKAGSFGPFEIIRARQVVEGELAALVAAKPKAGTVRALREALDEMRGQADAGRMPIAGDRRFHLVIAEAAGNGPLMSTVAELYDQRNEPLFEQLGAHFETVASWRKAIAEHEAVVDAIAARDAISARRAMQVHLQRSHDRFARAWPRKTPSRNGT